MYIKSNQRDGEYTVCFYYLVEQCNYLKPLLSPNIFLSFYLLKGALLISSLQSITSTFYIPPLSCSEYVVTLKVAMV